MVRAGSLYLQGQGFESLTLYTNSSIHWDNGYLLAHIVKVLQIISFKFWLNIVSHISYKLGIICANYIQVTINELQDIN